MSMKRIILASGSAIRADILRHAGVPFEIVKPDVDENEIKQKAKSDNLDLEALAMRLAEAKCLKVATRPDERDSIVIGSDQIMEFKHRAYDKPASLEEARSRLIAIQGSSHTLINAIAVAHQGEVVWRNIDRPTLHMRRMSEAEIDAYLQSSELDILKSVGAYQIEKLGSRLFERIDGDHFAVLGLSLFPLLQFLRDDGALAF